MAFLHLNRLKYGLGDDFRLHSSNENYESAWKTMCLASLDVLVFGIGAAVCKIGLYARSKVIEYV